MNWYFEAAPVFTSYGFNDHGAIAKIWTMYDAPPAGLAKCLMRFAKLQQLSDSTEFRLK